MEYHSLPTLRWFRAHLNLAGVPTVGVFVGAWLFAGPAFADTTFAVTWDAEGRRACITERTLRAAVERTIGRPLGDVERADIVIEGHETARTADGVSAQVIQRGRDGAQLGARKIEARDCEGLQQAATLVVALIVQADQEDAALHGDDTEPTDIRGRNAPHVEAPVPLAPSDDVPAPVPPAVPAAPRRKPIPPAPHARTPKPAPFELSLGVGVEAGTGLLPSLASSVAGVARLDRTGTPWSFDWMGAYALRQTVHRGASFGEFSAVEQRVRLCVAPYERGGLAFELCGGALWAVVIPKTTGGLDGGNGWASIGAPLASVGVDLGQGSAALRLDAGAALPLQRYLFTYRDRAGDLRSFYETGQAFVFLGLSGRVTIF